MSTTPPVAAFGIPPAHAVVPRRPAARPGRWVAAILCLAVLAFLVRAFAFGRIDWPYVATFFAAPVILSGLANTLILTAAAMALGIVLGLIAALMRLSQNPVSQALAAGYIWLFRGTPVYLQLLIWFNLALVFPMIGVPGLWEVRTVSVMTPFLAAWLGLGICQGAYTAEVIRGGILSIDSGQFEAAQAIGMTRWQLMRHVVLPQTLRVITPPVGNEVIGMLKTTSLAAVVNYGELIHSASLIYYVNSRVIELLIVCAIYYLIAVTLLSRLQRMLEARLSRSTHRSMAQGRTEAEVAP
ncbi:amino acid ABC transporter permease [Variovorax sp. J31P207]|uniref:amino acid ABC transporter permease n=1 Tax=Variovorax sp. J31P207 TaxID=3053510 RepID=UPI002576F3CA|nr:amino acid ABC transporter permease [Variovorax sp. J31P207]MDM0071609.1 amino acid ABC transporter permease [Variovorax sp. J31P207]